MSDNTQNDIKFSYWFLLPLFMLVIVTTASSVIFGENTVETNASAISSPYRAIVLMVVYTLAFICLTRIPGFTLDVIKKTWPYIIVLSFVILSVLWSSFPMKVLINFIHYIGTSFVLMAAVYSFNIKESSVFYFLSYTLGLVVVFSFVFVLVGEPSAIQGFSGRWQGLAGHPNTLGLICVLSVWANLACLLQHEWQTIKWLNASLLIISLILITGTNSITSSLLVVFVSIGLILIRLIDSIKGTKRLLVMLIPLWLMLVLLGFLWIFNPEILTLKGFLHFLGRKSDLTGRTDLWEIAFKAISERPFMGWSFDANRSVLQNFKMAYGQFHNGYIDLWVRGGLFGLALFAVLIIQLSVSLVFMAKRELFLAGVWSLLLLTILIHNFAEASFMRASHPFWLIFLLMYFVVVTRTFDFGQRLNTVKKTNKSRDENGNTAVGQ